MTKFSLKNCFFPPSEKKFSDWILSWTAFCLGLNLSQISSALFWAVSDLSMLIITERYVHTAMIFYHWKRTIGPMEHRTEITEKIIISKLHSASVNYVRIKDKLGLFFFFFAIADLKSFTWCNLIQWRIQDFSLRRGRQPPMRALFGGNFAKMKELGPTRAGGPPGSASVIHK